MTFIIGLYHSQKEKDTDRLVAVCSRYFSSTRYHSRVVAVELFVAEFVWGSATYLCCQAMEQPLLRSGFEV